MSQVRKDVPSSMTEIVRTAVDQAVEQQDRARGKLAATIIDPLVTFALTKTARHGAQGR